MLEYFEFDAFSIEVDDGGLSDAGHAHDGVDDDPGAEDAMPEEGAEHAADCDGACDHHGDVRFGAADDWEYWGNGTYWERAPDGGYTGNTFGW
jgi:hypothetical protein